jgi:beta-phosphoglucomutase
MHWIHHYHLFLFDFDGIVVNTEELHYRSYVTVCANRGFFLDWDLSTYLRHAMYTSTGVKEAIYAQFPQLQRLEPKWDVLYEEKKIIYQKLLQREGTSLMPGVADLLSELQAEKITRCVVTHSPYEQILTIREQHPILNSIPEWITREQYYQPKPAPECYQKAIAKLKKPNERVVGFEDSPRGLQALLQTEAEAFFLSNYFEAGEVRELLNKSCKPFSHFGSFVEMFKTFSG